MLQSLRNTKIDEVYVRVHSTCMEIEECINYNEASQQNNSNSLIDLEAPLPVIPHYEQQEQA